MSSFNITTNYIGTFFSEPFTSELFKTDSLTKVRVLPNIKSGKAYIPRVEVSNVLKNRACDFSASGTIALTEKYIEARLLAINLEMCIPELEVTWQSEFMRAGANNSDVPQTLEQFILKTTLNRTAMQIEQNFWAGVEDITVNGAADAFDGIYTLLLADGGADVAGTTASSSTIVTELGKITAFAAGDADTQGMYVKTDGAGGMNAKLYVSLNMYAAYKQALWTGVYTYGTSTTPGTYFFQGYEVVPCSGLPANKAIMASPENLVLAVDLLSDMNELRLIDLRNTTGSDSVRIVGNITAGANYGIRSEIVLYA